MNNFEKRKFLDYLDKLLPMTDIDNYSFGDVFDIGGQLYYRNKNNLEELKIDKNCFEQLFSNIGNLAISQGALGDCYFVAAIYDLINNPNTKGKIYQLFELSNHQFLIHWIILLSIFLYFHQ